MLDRSGSAMKLLLGWALFLCLLPGTAKARQLGSTLSVGDIAARVDRLTEGNVGRGFVPVRVQAQNTGSEEARLELDYSGGWTRRMARGKVNRSITLLPGESASIELLVPASRNVHGSCSNHLTLSSRDARSHVDLQISEDDFNERARIVCLLGDTQLSEARVVTIRGALPMDNGSVAQGVFDCNKVRNGGNGQGAQVFSLAFDDLPEHTVGWSSVDSVLVDVTGPIRGGPGWSRLLEWVRQGGQVMFVGEDLGQNLKGIEGLSDLLQERFRVKVEGSGDFYRAGFGTLAVVPPLHSSKSFLANPLDLAGHLHLLDEGDGVNTKWAAMPSNMAMMYRAQGARVPWRVGFPSKALGLRGVVFFLLLFSLIVGPLNVFLIKRKQRPGLLFVSVPVISLVTTALIVLFGFFRQGFGTEGYANSVVILDQVTHQATTALRRRMVAGSGGQALSPRPSTTVLVPDEGLQSATRIVEEEGNQLRLSGDFLPVRTQTEHLILTAAARVRARLEFKPGANGTLQVTNGLGVPLKSLEVRGPDGSIYASGSPLALGASSILEKIDAPQLHNQLIANEKDPLFHLTHLPECGFFAIADGLSTITDNCSVEMEELASIHVVMGYLDDDPKRWTP